MCISLQAESTGGEERAKHLHAGISAVSKQLTTVEQRESDPVLTYYAHEVVTILATPANSASMQEIHAAYRERAAVQDKWIESHRNVERILNKIAAFRDAKDFDTGVRFLDKTLSSVSGEDWRWRLEMERQSFLVGSGEMDAAIANIRSLLKQGPDIKLVRRLHKQEIQLLFYLEREDDGFKACEKWIATAAGSSLHLEALEERAKWLTRKRPEEEETIAAWLEYRDAVPQDTDKWLNATHSLAQSLLASGQPAKAADLREQILTVLERQRDGELELDWPWTWARQQTLC